MILPEGIELRRDDKGLALVGGDMILRADFARLLPRLKQSNLEHELLIRAVRIKGKAPGTVLDATAGFGEDSMILAAAGFRVLMYEYDPVIAALLRDAMTRASDIAELSGAISRMELHEENSIAAMSSASVPADVIYLDPMFPERQKSALIKKKFQLLQKLEIPCDNEEEMLDAAIASGTGKIVIKRPIKGPYLAGRKPDYSYSGKAIRYDCILPVRNADK